MGAKVMRVGSNTFCYPFIPKISQNQVLSTTIKIIECFAFLVPSDACLMRRIFDILNERVAEVDTSDPHDFNGGLLS
jgi:hypothetical protein